MWLSLACEAWEYISLDSVPVTCSSFGRDKYKPKSDLEDSLLAKRKKNYREMLPQ